MQGWPLTIPLLPQIVFNLPPSASVDEAIGVDSRGSGRAQRDKLAWLFRGSSSELAM